MSLRTKAILNYGAAVLFVGLTVLHICNGESILRVFCDVVPALWFGTIATVFLRKYYK